MKTFYKKLIVAVFSLLIAVCLMGSYFLFLAPKASEGEKNITVKIVYAENSFSYKVNTNTQTVLELLKEMDNEY